MYLKQEANEIAEQLLTLKKEDLKALGKHLRLLFCAKMLKADIQNAIVDHLGDGIIEVRSVEIPVAESRIIELQHRIELVCFRYAVREKYQSQFHSKSHSNSSKGSDNSSSSYQSNDSDVEKQTSVSASVDSKQK